MTGGLPGLRPDGLPVLRPDGSVRPTVALDHLVVAAGRLEDGIAWVADALGAEIPPGGRHAIMNTHNAVARLDAPGHDAVYLEIIAIDPEAGPPQRPRWFGLDDPALQARLAASGPFLHHWVVRTDDITAATLHDPACFGEVLTMRRGDLSWQIAVRDDGNLLFGGAMPSVIQWSAGPHVSRRMADCGLTLVGLEVYPPAIGFGLDAMGASSLANCVRDPWPGEPNEHGSCDLRPGCAPTSDERTAGR